MKTNSASTCQVCHKLQFFVLALIAIAIIVPSEIRATAYYWDLNQGTAGVGGATPSGNWDGTTQNWNTSITGGSGTYVATPGTGNDGTFTANSESTGNYTITLTGTQNAKSLTAKYGNATLHGGTLALDNNISSGTTYLAASAGANLTLDISCTLSVNNSSTAAAGNFVNLGAAASQTVTINGPVTATVNNSANKIFIRSTTAGNNIINYDLGTDAAFKTGLQAGGFDGVAAGGTLTLKGPQTLGTTPYVNSARTGTFNIGDVVNTGNAVSLGVITLQKTTADLTGATININSAVSLGSANILLSSGGLLNVGGSLATSGSTTLGATSDTVKHGATIKVLSGGSATLGAISVLDGSTFTDAGTLTGTTLTLGEATGNTAGNLVLGDSAATGAATFTGFTTPGSGAKTIVGGNATASTLTLNLAGTTTLGTTLTLGGGSGNQNNLTLDKTGAGTLVMGNGANTYSGGTIFENGGIQLGANNALGSGPLTIGTANTSLSVNSGFLKVQLSGYDQTVTGLANGNVGTIIIEANASPAGGNNILTVNQAANTISSYSGTLRNISTGGSGVLSLTKSGNGTLSLSAANGYTGNTTVSAGTLQLTAGSLANTAITVNSGTFAVQPGSSTTLAAGSTSTAGVGASLNLGGNIFDMTDGAISQFNLYQGSGFGTALTIGNGATLKFNLGNSGADKMVVSSAASVSGTINVTLDTSLMTGPVTAGNYSLITAASGLDGGIWQFSDTGNQTKTVTVNGSAYTLTLNHGATSVYVTVAAKTASQLVFTTQPSASTVAGVAFAQQPVVKIEDQYNNMVTSGADATKSVALTLTTGTGTLGGTTSMNAVAGVADFTGKGLNINLVGADKVLTATATVAAGTMTTTTSPAFGITPGAASQLAVTGFPASATAGSAGNITVTAKDTFGNTAASYAGTITFSVGVTDAGKTLPANYTFTTGTGNDNGVHTFSSGVTLTKAVASGGQSITATDTGTGSITGTEGGITVNAGALDHFVISTISSPQTSGTAIAGITITAQDANNNTCDTGANAFTGTVTYGGTAGITGTSSSFLEGVLSGVSVTPLTAGIGKTFTVAASGKTGSATIDVNPVITASAGVNGSISPSGATVVTYNANQTFAIAPNANYAISDVVVDSTTHLGALTSYTFNNVTANHTISATFMIACTSPVIEGGISPDSLTATVGNQVVLTLTNVTGTVPFAYQWLSNTVAIANATNSSYTNLSVTVADAGNYQVIVTNDCGAVTSSIAMLTVSKQTPVIATAPTAGGITYGQALNAATLSGGSVTNAAGAAVPGSFAFASPTNVPSAGTPSVNVTFTPGDTNNYNNVATMVATAVAQAPLGVTANNTNKVYDGMAFSGGNGVTYSGFVNAETPAVLDGTLSYGGTSQGATNAGTYSIIPSGLTSANYTISYTNGTLMINQGSTFVGASSTKNPSGYKDAISFIATLPVDATGSVVFSSTNGAFSTNTVSGVTTTSLSMTNLPRGTNVITVAYLGAGNYIGSTNTVNQIVTNHLPVASVMTVKRTAGLALIIALSDVATNWNDADGDTVELTGVNIQSTNGVNLFALNWSTNLDGSIVTTNAYAFIGYTNSPNVADQISYSISDGQGGTNIGYVNIVIQGSVTGTNSITGHDFTSPYSNTVTAYGIPYFYYTLERSTNLTSPVWVDVSTNQAAANGAINAVDTFWDLGGVKPSPSAFYQLKWQP